MSLLTEATPKDYTISCVRFMPSDVKDMWDMLFSILKRSALYDDAGVARMLNDCIVPGGLQMWVIKGETAEGKIFPAGCIVTAVHSEPYSNKCWMVLLHVNDVVHIDFEQWRTVYDTLFDFAEERKCQWMEVYTDNPRAQELLTAFGFTTAAYRKAV